MEKRYTISELEALTKISRRTIHFYIQKGLIPPADCKGGGATYSEDTLTRLKIIKELQKQRLTLDEIKNALDSEYERLKVTVLNGQEEYYTKTRSKDELDNFLLTNMYEIYGNFLIPEPKVPSRYKEEKLQPEKEQILRFKLQDGIELNIKDEVFQKYRKIIEEAINEFIKYLKKGA